LRSRQVAIGNILRAGSTAAAGALFLRNLGRTKGNVDESNANKNTHDRHGKHGIHKGQHQDSCEDKQLEETHEPPVVVRRPATHVSQNMRRKRRDKAKILVELGSDGSFNFRVVVDGLKNTTLETMFSTHATSKLGEAAMEKKQCSKTQNSIKDGQSKEGLLFVFDNEHLMLRHLHMLLHLFHTAKRVRTTRGHGSLVVSGHETSVLAATKREMHSILWSMEHAWMNLSQATSQAMAMFVALGLWLGHCMFSVLNKALGEFHWVPDRSIDFFFSCFFSFIRADGRHMIRQAGYHGIKDLFGALNLLCVGGSLVVERNPNKRRLFVRKTDSSVHHAVQHVRQTMLDYWRNWMTEQFHNGIAARD
jgi:hypothetical protein